MKFNFLHDIDEELSWTVALHIIKTDTHAFPCCLKTKAETFSQTFLRVKHLQKVKSSTVTKIMLSTTKY